MRDKSMVLFSTREPLVLYTVSDSSFSTASFSRPGFQNYDELFKVFAPHVLPLLGAECSEGGSTYP